jgi:hypothetical protein
MVKVEFRLSNQTFMESIAEYTFDRGITRAIGRKFIKKILTVADQDEKIKGTNLLPCKMHGGEAMQF